ncbi:hypothetical protein [Aquimarina sp. MMG016]|uniref:hypothetical protein n=1 Tax=Aquimarina sp. MMG016 TaxID=2822690 RepID=UPI001B3A2BBB|nr:hypothetical protein [Aquimarina sp. MMG016]MBQ4819621.1 hypothetical protein [Aquimarina sp. MMG016]
MSDILKTAANNLLSNLQPIEIKTFSIKIEDIRKAMITENTWFAKERAEGCLGKLFKDLDKINKGDCLYWYETENEEIAKQMVIDLNNFREANNKYKGEKKYRSLSAKGKPRNIDSKVLYVGTVKHRNRKDGLTTIGSRTFQHLGFYDKGSTGALHLWYWAKYSVKLNVIELPGDLSDYRNVFEKLLAIELKPLIGVHR